MSSRKFKIPRNESYTFLKMPQSTRESLHSARSNSDFGLSPNKRLELERLGKTRRPETLLPHKNLQELVDLLEHGSDMFTGCSRIYILDFKRLGSLVLRKLN